MWGRISGETSGLDEFGSRLQKRWMRSRWEHEGEKKAVPGVSPGEMPMLAAEWVPAEAEKEGVREGEQPRREKGILEGQPREDVSSVTGGWASAR